MKIRSINPIAGFSLVELMVAMTIGLILLAALATILVNSSHTQKEQQKAMQQIENGRYALDIISHDLHLAGFYGGFYNLPPLPTAAMPMPAALPDPCSTSVTDLLSALPLPVQGYNNPAILPSCLDNANYLPNTDILVVRRASTAVTGSSPVNNEVYMQSNPLSVEIQIGKSTANLAFQKADGTAVDVFTKTGAPAEIRKYHVHIYFISPCSVPTGPATANAPATCKATDDGGTPIPTLKRLELTSGGTGPTMNLLPLVEGIENLQIDYGVDDTPNTPSSTGFLGDGAPDCYDTDPGSSTNGGISPAAGGCTAGNPGSIASWSEVVTANLYVLARNPQITPEYSDAKIYNLGLDFPAVGPKNDGFKRHVYQSVVRLTNSSSRREVP